MTTPTNIILEFDDLHWLYPENCLEYIDAFVEDFSDIKLNFFAISFLRGQAIYLNDNWCNRLRKHIENGNVQLAIHGFDHSHIEFEHIGKDEAAERITKAQEFLTKANLPFEKIFRGPFWGINENTYEVLVDQGFTHVYTHKRYEKLNPNYDITSVFYNWNVMYEYENMDKDEYAQPVENDIVVSHGHTHNVGNGIAESYFNISEFIDEHDLNFMFLSEYPKGEQGGSTYSYVNME